MVSAKLTPAARTAIRTSPAPTAGSGQSWTWSMSGPPVRVRTTAFITANLLVGVAYDTTACLTGAIQDLAAPWVADSTLAGSPGSGTAGTPNLARPVESAAAP